MIKAGDKVKFKKYDETIYTVVNVEEEHVRVINITGTQLMQVRKDFIDVVEQYIDYKQRADELEDRISEEIRKRFQLEDRWRKAYERADELEKRWEKLKEHFIKEKEQSFGMLSWSRNNGVLELIERLQEDDNA